VGRVGLEPTTGGLLEVRLRAPTGLAAQMTRIIARTALTTLGVSDAPVHEPVHDRGASHLVLLLCVTSPTALGLRPSELGDHEPTVTGHGQLKSVSGLSPAVTLAVSIDGYAASQVCPMRPGLD